MALNSTTLKNAIYGALEASLQSTFTTPGKTWSMVATEIADAVSSAVAEQVISHFQQNAEVRVAVNTTGEGVCNGITEGGDNIVNQPVTVTSSGSGEGVAGSAIL